MTYQIWHMDNGSRFVVYANIHHIGTYDTLDKAEAAANSHNATLGGEPLTPWGLMGGPSVGCQVTACESGQPGAIMAMPNPRKRRKREPAQPEYRANPFRLQE